MKLPFAVVPFAIVPLCLLPVGLHAQSGLNRPDLGLMIDRQGSLRQVAGVSGSFLVGAPQAAGALSFACSQTLCAAKLKDSILFSTTDFRLCALASGSTFAAPEGDAVIAADESGATIYFRESSQFERWQNGALTPLDWVAAGEILSIGSGTSSSTLAVRLNGGVWIVSTAGAVLDSLPSSAQAVLLLSGATVYTTASDVVLRRADGSEINFAAAGVSQLFAMSDGWVEARGKNALFALRIDSGHESLYWLPQPALRSEAGSEAQR
ncbi:MAG TPA: hypothetical protein VIY49_23920 [Bryobacteraceae bacterium]